MRAWDFNAFLTSHYRAALGRLGLRPSDFWRSTPREIEAMIRGQRWRERREWERAAWLAGMCISPHVKRVPQISRLLSFLGPEESETGTRPEPVTPEQAKVIVEDLARQHKRKAWTLLSDQFAGDKE